VHYGFRISAISSSGATSHWAIGVMTILVVLILPLPPILLDLFLAVSIILSVLILMTTLFIQAPLEFSRFRPCY